MNSPLHTGRSLSDLIRELRDETTTLLRQEVALAKTEMSEKINTVTRNVAFAIVGGAVAHLALIFLLLSASGGIETGIEATEAAPHGQWIAPLIVGLVVGAIGALLLMKAKSGLSKANMKPQKTIESLQEDKQWLQRKVA